MSSTQNSRAVGARAAEQNRILPLSQTCGGGPASDRSLVDSPFAQKKGQPDVGLRMRVGSSGIAPGMRLPLLAAALLFACLPLAQADILHLRDGSRHYGTLERETDSEVIFRVRLTTDGATMLRRFTRSDVSRVERTTIDAPPDGEATARDENASPKFDAREAEQVLREAFELLDDGDRVAALRALQRLVNGSERTQIQSLSDFTQSARGIALRDLLAQTRLDVAMHGDHGRLFQLQYVSPYEADAMAALLEKLQSDNCAAVFQGRTVESWAGEPTAYSELAPDAPDLVHRTRLATAAISARLRFDPRLKRDAASRGKLIILRDQLTALAAHVRGMTGFTQLGAIDDETDPTFVEARRIATSQPASQPTSQLTTRTSRTSEDKP